MAGAHVACDMVESLRGGNVAAALSDNHTQFNCGHEPLVSSASTIRRKCMELTLVVAGDALGDLDFSVGRECVRTGRLEEEERLGRSRVVEFLDVSGIVSTDRDALRNTEVSGCVHLGSEGGVARSEEQACPLEDLTGKEADLLAASGELSSNGSHNDAY